MAYRGIKGKAPLTLNKDPKWRLEVNISSQLLSSANEPHYPLNRVLDEPQTWSGLRQAKYLLPLPRFTPMIVYLIT